MDKLQLEQLLQNGEDTWLDWKRDFPKELLGGNKNQDWEVGKGKLLKDLVAIANSIHDKTGYLVYGVVDHGAKRQVMGKSRSWDDADFQQWCENAFDPPIIFSYHEVSWDGQKTVGVFVVNVSPKYPHVAIRSIGGELYEGQVWFRKGSKNTIAKYGDLEGMFRRVEPYKTEDRCEGKIAKEVGAFYRERGRESVGSSIDKKDDRLAEGYEIAFYPNTRREVWMVDRAGRQTGILLLKPKR